ncbi:Glycosyltransferase family 28, N-terminal domain [Dillenia turbinata]|uniref:Glycosyltransferase family 28, N-terminal domain n=1 Tax=Dillenia turbinata TaxID=194707 RepID=A0AAN8URC9_9MAGN
MEETSSWQGDRPSIQNYFHNCDHDSDRSSSDASVEAFVDCEVPIDDENGDSEIGVVKIVDNTGPTSSSDCFAITKKDDGYGKFYPLIAVDAHALMHVVMYRLVERDPPKLSTEPGETSKSGRSELTSVQVARQIKALRLLAAKIYDEKVPFKKKLRWLRRIATVKDNGTVQFEVPANIKPDTIGGAPEVAENGISDIGELDTIRIQGIPPLQIVMLIVGTRGDVQPFVAIGKHLQEHGHRVRLATHANFREFVLAAGLEFFPLGGDPKVLAGYAKLEYVMDIKSSTSVLGTNFK